MSFPITVPKTPIYRGDSLVLSYVLKEGDPAAVIDLVAAGWTSWRAQWRPFVSSDSFVEMTVDTSLANVGRITISASAAQTQNMGGGVWDLQAERPGEVRTWLRSAVIFTKDVTHA